MPKLKLKEWKGLYTNTDENDQNLEYARVSINFRNGRGKLEYEGRNLVEYELPVIDPAFGDGWEWETGIYAVLTNDPLKQNPIAAKYNCLIVIAKKFDDPVYHRLIFLKDLTNNSAWFELSRYGNTNQYIKIENYNSSYQFTNSYFDTTIDAQAYFRQEAGHVKLFLPHDCFWIGRLERSTTFPINGTVNFDTEPNKWYIDKLVEAYDYTTPTTSTIGYPTRPHRIAWVGNINITTDTSKIQQVSNISIGLDPSDTQEYHVLPIENSSIGSEYARVYVYRGFLTETNDPLPSTVPYSAPSYETLPNSIWAYRRATPLVVTVFLSIPAAFFDYYEIFDPVTKEAVDINTVAIYNNDTDIYGVSSGDNYLGTKTLANRASYEISKDNWDAIVTEQRIRYKGIGGGATAGFSAAEKEFHMIITALLDEREEVIIHAHQQAVSVSDPWGIEIIGGSLARHGNYRVTRIRYYVQLDSQEIHYLLKEVPLLLEAEDVSSDFVLSTLDDTAITLGQNIGIEIDPKKMYEYSVITDFRDFITESGISIGISNRDYVNVYYSVLGGGNLQPDLMYRQNILPIYGADVVNAVAVVNTDLAVFTDNSMYLIRPVEDAGALVFTIKQTLEFGVKDKYDICQIQGGLAIHTIHGIYTTTGVQSNLISEPIDNIVKQYYSTGRIYYNKDLHELYYKPTESEDLYRFRFKDAVWETINKTTLPSI